MTLQVIADLTARGVVLHLEDGRLRAGPASALTEETRTLIRRHSEQIKRVLGHVSPGGPVARSGQQPDAIRQWQRQWRPVWEQERGSLPACAPSRYEAERRICELVAAWNRSTGQQRIPAEVLEHLERADYGDRELMTPGGLALYVATVLGDQV